MDVPLFEVRMAFGSIFKRSIHLYNKMWKMFGDVGSMYDPRIPIENHQKKKIFHKADTCQLLQRSIGAKGMDGAALENRNLCV